MASAFGKSNRMRRMESKKSHSWWWDSHISPKNSKWLQENLEEMDQQVKKMLKLIEEDADSFAKKAELYFKKRPELISLVEEFYRIYRSLAERYDHVTGELKKSIPSDLQSQGSGISSDVGSEPSPDQRPARTKSGPRAAGFDFFLGSGGSCGSDLNSKGDGSSTLDSESESDDSSVNNYSTEQGLRMRIIELENELLEVKEVAEGSTTTPDSFSASLAAYEEELISAKAKIEQSEEEIVRLTIELDKYKSEGADPVIEQKDSIELLEGEEGLAQTMQALEEEVAGLRQELASKTSSIQNLQEQLKTAQKEGPVWKTKLEKEKREVSKLLDRMTRYKNNLSDRDQEIRVLKEAMSNANKSLSEENEQLQSDMTLLKKERSYLEDNIKEMDLRCQLLEEDLRRAKAALGAEIEQLKADIVERNERIEELNEKIEELNVKYGVLVAEKDDLNARVSDLGEEISSKDDEIARMSVHAELARKTAEELKSRVEELELEVERKEKAILEGAEEKREAIRQLCCSIEHYRSEYYELRTAVIGYKRSAVIGHKRTAVMAA
ncbi:hypothetical protein ABFS82_14G063300 [Erythranthe guttata]|uniref:protein NETWORKED 4A-like n=1 Tax=Erythranthe guttata TaxID=4155 RepID=UPI00064DDD54|nr:PREDICTED: protein NETWORKED 4A-like [Erythranthe guttata]XP_012838096.1 PREDICTED: protein NETWORKED 4A-like [Erythranthe guttata]XP_012838097.1 PREDICTED: protein NETWORKED 4A-like [Erythranthe guttata]|eukprot:XP_012838095.1 PREDICTED: protein NETWORKED 4A-like [Erythranthe guttata]